MAGMRDDSAGDYGQWTNDPNQSLLDYLKMKGSDVGGGAYNALANITGALSPIGTSPEGNMALQVPPMVNALMGSGKTIADRGGWGFSGVEEIDAPLKKAWADVLWTGYGGNALAGLSKPRGALGAGAMREAGGLPMDQASRMARAKEMGFDTDTTWYHGSKNNIEAFDSSGDKSRFLQDYAGETFFTKDPEVASRYALSNMGREGMLSSGLSRYEEAFNEAASLGMPAKDIYKYANEVGQTGANVTPAYVRSENPLNISANADNPAAFWDDNFKSVREAAQAGGHDSIVVTTPDGQAMKVVLDPRNIRSVNAAFDPAKADSANLLYSDNKPSILGSALATAGEQPKGITAYHGSPHDFDKFSLDRIGTGEGAQAYGHGLYFADSEGVARSYRDTLSKNSSVTIGGKVINQTSPTADKYLSYYFRDGDPSPQNALINAQSSEAASRANAKTLLDAANDRANKNNRGFLLAQAKLKEQEALSHADGVRRLQEHIQSGDIRGDNQGKMYQVRINADPESFLDWDKPLSQQPEKVKALAAAKGIDIGKPTKDWVQDGDTWHLGTEADYPVPFGNVRHRPQYGDFDASVFSRGIGGSKKFSDVEEAKQWIAAQVNDLPDGRKGAELYQALGDPVQASNALREYGVPGISYLDGLSRNNPAIDAIANGTRNHVLFDDSLIEILKKYGIAAGAVGAGALAQPDQASAQDVPDWLKF